MCGRYYRRSDKQAIAERFRVKNDVSGLVLPDADYNVAPTTFQPVIRNDRENNARELVLMRWGLIPFFTRQLSDVKGISTINARAETISTSNIYRRPFERHRCLIPADGFYEWALRAPDPPAGIDELLRTAGPPGKPLPSRRTKPVKIPFRFDMANGKMFAFAGLWDGWKEPKHSPQANDTWLQSYTIITTEPNELTAQVHTRMPVILHERDYDRWLDRDLSTPGQLPTDLLRPYPAEEMESHLANPLVGNVKNNSIEMLNSK